MVRAESLKRLFWGLINILVNLRMVNLMVIGIKHNVDKKLFKSFSYGNFGIAYNIGKRMCKKLPKQIYHQAIASI